MVEDRSGGDVNQLAEVTQSLLDATRRRPEPEPAIPFFDNRFQRELLVGMRIAQSMVEHQGGPAS